MRGTGEGGENPWLQPSASTEFVRTFLQVASSLQSADHAAHHLHHMSLTNQIATDVAREIRQKAETESQMLIAQATAMMCSSVCSAAFFTPPKTAEERLPKSTAFSSTLANSLSTTGAPLGGGASSSFQGLGKDMEAQQSMLETLASVLDRNLEEASSMASSSSGRLVGQTLRQVTDIMDNAQMCSAIERA